MFPRPLLLASILAFVFGPASAQTYYGGYNLGPDYGAMLNGMMAQDRLLGQQIQQQEQAIVQQVMQDPQAQRAYQQHLAGGGQMSFPQFAYQYAATARMTPDGIARYQRSESLNRAREAEGLRGLREAERQTSEALRNYNDGFSRNQNEFGNYLRGNSTWINPNTGASVVLPHTQPYVPYQDHRSGYVYQMDNLGNYYAQAPDGYWYQMQPWR